MNIADMASTGAPHGCGSSISSIYYNLCDLTIVWGIVVEAVAAAGVLTAFVLLVTLMACLPSVTDKRRKGMVALQAAMLVSTLGLFGLSFAFVVGRYSTTCAVRRFLFGVLFSGCLSCLVMHALWLALLKRTGQGTRSWMFCLGALGLWLVEVIINTEWLLISLVTNPPMGVIDSDLACSFLNQDFVMALIYVMFLLLAAILMTLPSLRHKHTQWRKDAVFILVTGLFTMAIWIAWIVMYVKGNRLVGSPSWDDPTLAVALVSNAWVFLLLYAIPQTCFLTQGDPDQEMPDDVDEVYPTRNLVYDTILRVPTPQNQNLYIENKAFTMDEPPTGPVSPYGAYNGQLRSCVYQPTEIALVTKGLGKMDQDVMVIPRARTQSFHSGSSSSLPHLAESLPSEGLSYNGHLF